MDEFFIKTSLGEVKTLGLRRTWEFIIAPTVGILAKEDETGNEGEERLFGVIQELLEREGTDGDLESPNNGTKGNEDAIFMSTFIPRHLGEIRDPENHIERERANNDAVESRLQKLEVEDPLPHVDPSAKSVRFEDDVDSSDTGSEADDDGDDGERKPKGFKHEDKDAKKVRYTACFHLC